MSPEVRPGTRHTLPYVWFYAMPNANDELWAVGSWPAGLMLKGSECNEAQPQADTWRKMYALKLQLFNFLILQMLVRVDPPQNPVPQAQRSDQI
jgi:hypothetical protein